MRTDTIYTQLEELARLQSQPKHIRIPVLLRQIKQELPRCMDGNMILYLDRNEGLKNLLVAAYLHDCRYMLNIFHNAYQQFIFEEYLKFVQVTTGLFQMAALLEQENLFTEFKTGLAETMKQPLPFRAGFRREYFSLSNKNRNASLEQIIHTK